MKFLKLDQGHKMEDGGPDIVTIFIQWYKLSINQIMGIRMIWSELGAFGAPGGLGPWVSCPL